MTGQNATLNSSQFALELRNVHLAYRQESHVCHVLQGTTFRVHQGETVLLMGPSGCGKSTLLSIIGCILMPDRGSVNILGHEVTKLNEEGRAIFRRENIGFVFQRFHLIRGLSALENVLVPLSLRGRTTSKSRARAQTLLDAVGIGDKSQMASHQLSTGQCQRVAIARALACDPPVILADEPTASLDAENGQVIMRQLNDLAKQFCKTVVVVTHDDRIIPFADRVCTMQDGELSDAVPNAQSETALTF